MQGGKSRYSLNTYYTGYIARLILSSHPTLWTLDRTYNHGKVWISVIPFVHIYVNQLTLSCKHKKEFWSVKITKTRPSLFVLASKKEIKNHIMLCINWCLINSVKGLNFFDENPMLWSLDQIWIDMNEIGKGLLIGHAHAIHVAIASWRWSSCISSEKEKGNF